MEGTILEVVEMPNLRRSDQAGLSLVPEHTLGATATTNAAGRDHPYPPPTLQPVAGVVPFAILHLPKELRVQLAAEPLPRMVRREHRTAIRTAPVVVDDPSKRRNEAPSLAAATSRTPERTKPLLARPRRILTATALTDPHLRPSQLGGIFG
jgi:hypothetical protein